MKAAATLGSSVLLAMALNSCGRTTIRPMHNLSSRLADSAETRRDPSLGQGWLASISSRGGRERIDLINLRNGQPVPLPGLNRADAQPISISVSGDGERLALVRLRDGITEVMLYRRSLNSMQRLNLNPPGVPRTLSLDGRGNQLAVQVSRNGRWEVDLIQLP
jgi:Tol biopolymer transport system component